MKLAVGSARRLNAGQGPWAMLLLAAAAMFLGGCSTGDPTSPADVTASWDSLEYATADGQATVEIDGSGALRVTDAVAGTYDGLLGPLTWRSLEAALEQAGLAPCTPPAGTGAGAVLVAGDGELRGFLWADPAELDPAEAQVVALLEQIRSQAGDPAVNPRVEGFPIARLLHDFDATGPAAGVLVRDEDQLIELLRSRLTREAVVLPEIDFSREMVLAIFLGPRGNDAFDVVVDGYAAHTVNGFLKVAVNRYAREADCPAVGDGSHGAFEVVRLPRSEAQVFLDWRTVTLECVEP